MANENDNDKTQLTDELLNKLNSKKKRKLQPPNKSFRLKTFHFFHRLWQICFSIPFAILAVILHFILIIRKLFLQKAVFNYFQFYGKKGEIQTINLFNVKKGSSLSLFYHVISGKLSLAGYSLNLERCVGDAFIYDYPPGMITLWYIRASSRTAYEGRKETDMEYIRNELLKAELKPSPLSFAKLVKAEFLLIIRFLIAKIFHSVKSGTIEMMIDPIYLFSIRLRNISMQKSLDEISNTINKCRSSNSTFADRRQIYFVNPDCLNKIFEKNMDDYHHFLYDVDKKDMIFADGIGINIAADMMGYPKNENVNGTDMFPRLCQMSADKGFSIFLVGARPGIPELVKTNMEKEFPGLNIIGTQHGYFDQKIDSENVVNQINNIDPDIILVAFGVPAQERWINKWYDKLKCPVIMGVGGLFDFYSGRIKRAPRWMRDIGLEWLYRLLMEPKRMFKRYIIGNPLFLKRVKALKKCSAHVQNRILKLRKLHKSDFLNIDDNKLFQKNHCELIDIMPQLFTFCIQNNISIVISAKVQNTENEVINTANKLFPDLNISAINSLDENIFHLIITDHELQQDYKNNLIISDKKFFKEFSLIEIIQA